jgi:hypothetical protein
VRYSIQRTSAKRADSHAIHFGGTGGGGARDGTGRNGTASGRPAASKDAIRE